MTPVEQSEGFSLIELLVVVALTSILAIGATLALPRSPAAIDQAISEFQGDIQDVSRRAMLSGADHALAPVATGWQMERREGEGSWTQFAERAHPGLSVTGSRIVLHPDGRAGQGALEFSTDGNVARCVAKGGGRAQCRANP